MVSPSASPSLEVHRLARATSIGFLVFLFVTSAPAIYLAFSIPKIKKILEDVLGSSDRLPGLTKMLISNQAIIPWITLAIPLAGVLVVLMLPPVKTIIPIAIAIAAAGLLGAALSVGLNAPLTKIISGIYGM